MKTILWRGQGGWVAGGVVSHSGGGRHNFGAWMRSECFLAQIHQGSDDTRRLIETPLSPASLSRRDTYRFLGNSHRETLSETCQNTDVHNSQLITAGISFVAAPKMVNAPQI